MVSQPLKKVKCPNKKEEETKYILAFHAEGKKQFFFENMNF